MKNLKLTLFIVSTLLLLEFSYAQDWANLKRFQKENTEVIAPNLREHVIVFMGNSITEGWLRLRPEFFVGKPYVNRGISGQTTPQMLVRFRQDVINLKPSVVVILAGINDIAGNTGPSTIEGIADNIMSMAELAKANNIKVVLCSVLPAFDFPWRQGLEPAEKVVKLNAILKSYAKKHDFVYVDYFTAMANESNGLKEELGDDGVHPNATGYSIMEPLIQHAITEALSYELVDPTLNNLQNQFLNNQAEALLSRANKVFSNSPPNWPETEARKSALLLLDGVLHDVYAPQRPPVKKFLKTRIKKAVAEIDHTEIINGARIWKLYNHGFLIKTKSVTIGFDLVSGKSAGIEGFSIGNDDMVRLINQCDVLFISHRHGDHADEWVAQSFIDQGKPVVAPPEVWRDKSIYDHITHLNREPHTRQTLSIQDGQQELKVVVYPGHQNLEVENNVYLVITPEDLSFSQMGDQYNDDDFEWIDEVGNNHVVDVLMPNCWTADIARVVKGFNPTLIITGHENEMGHTIDHREPYWLTYQRQTGSDRFGGSKNVGYDNPLILMTWGESYLFKRENFSNFKSGRINSHMQHD